MIFIQDEDFFLFFFLYLLFILRVTENPEEWVDEWTDDEPNSRIPRGQPGTVNNFFKVSR